MRSAAGQACPGSPRPEPVLRRRKEEGASTLTTWRGGLYCVSSLVQDTKKATKIKTVEFDQKGCIFDPHVFGFMAGANVELKSSDPLNHTVDSELRNSPFNTNITGGGTFKPNVGGPERIPGEVVCDIHLWMEAWWMVVDYPYITVTDEKGNFEIKNAPARTQKVVVWQEAAGFVTAPSGNDVTIKPNDTKVQGFTIDPAKVKPAS